MDYVTDFDEFIENVTFRAPTTADEQREARAGASAHSGKSGRGVAADEKIVEMKEWSLPTDLSSDIYGRKINPKLMHQHHHQIKKLSISADATASATPSASDDEYVRHDREKVKSLIHEQLHSDVKLVRQLESALETNKKVKEEDKKELKVEQDLLTYADTLHRGLKWLWFPMVLLGRLPFRLILKNNKAVIHVRKKSPAHIACTVTCIFSWVVFIWISFGLILLMIKDSDPPLSHNLAHRISPELAVRYWTDVFIFWTTLLQACISTTHILQEAEDIAIFIKEWYRVLDTSKIEVSKTLKMYIIMNEVFLVIFILAMIILFCIPEYFPHIHGTSSVILISLAQPFIWIADSDDRVLRFEDKSFFFERFAFIGLLLYIMAILFSWTYIVQFMVFCRCFRKGLKSINNRLAMILNVDDVQRVGPNAVRLTYEYIHKDYLGISTTGAKIGKIYSWTMCNYYLWAILVLVFELGEIFKFAKIDYRKPQENLNFEGTGIPLKLDAGPVISNILMHLIISAVCIFYVSHEGSGAHKEGKISYELARYRGLVDCTTQLERNFIRSIWIIVSEKCPVHVSPGRYFGVTHATVLTVFSTAFTYFIFWVQSVELRNKL